MPKKQLEIPGTEPVTIPEIEEAADTYVALRDKRMALTQKEIDARAVLIAAMDEHKLTSYRYDDNVVTVEPSEKVHVKKAKQETAESPD